jgi:hypothetical protein
MFRRISGSWELAKASAAVLAADKALIVFPNVSAICPAKPRPPGGPERRLCSRDGVRSGP